MTTKEQCRRMAKYVIGNGATIDFDEFRGKIYVQAYVSQRAKSRWFKAPTRDEALTALHTWLATRFIAYAKEIVELRAEVIYGE